MNMTTEQMRGLDAWIAANVFGWKWGHFAYVKNGLPDNPTEPIYLLPPDRFENCRRNANPFPAEHVANWPHRGKSLTPYYTRDPAAAMAVLKKCGEKVSTASIKIYQGVDEGPEYKPCWCIGWHGSKTITMADTLELTICLFAKQLFEKAQP